MVVLLKSYIFGDMKVLYLLDEVTKNVSLSILPVKVNVTELVIKNQAIDGLVQLKILGDIYPGGYAGGVTLRQSESVQNLKYENQRYDEGRQIDSIITYLIDERGFSVLHILKWHKATKVFELSTQFNNNSDTSVVLEMLSSFSLSGISQVLNGDGHDKMKVHRLRSVWSMEGRHDICTLEDLQLEPSWAGHAIRSERFGQVGSMPVNGFFPFLVIEDVENDLFWGAQLVHNASWQMEIYRKDDGLSISGGIADREFGHWMKTINPGSVFTTPSALISTCQSNGDGIDKIANRLTTYFEPIMDTLPPSEQTLPIIFNEYCTTWGNPSHENINEIVDIIKDKGFDYFVIDCGWYKEEGVPWDISMGDYIVSKELFPEGLEKTVSLIKDAGMKPGLWFEIENVGSAFRAYHNIEHLLTRDGQVLTTSMRRFWDMRDPWVKGYLNDKVIGTLRQYGFEYMKIDYNDTIGLGCDGAESLGEGLRENMQATVEFIDKVKTEIPNIVLENCASGGHRLEPLMIGKTSMSSFSDAHECEEIPIIAANLHRVMLPRQSQIWAVIQKDDSKKRIAYSMTSTMLGRMCLSGHVTELGKEQWDIIYKGMIFYKTISHIIKDGYSRRFGEAVTSYRHPKGWQGILRTNDNGDALLVIHTFNSEVGVITIDLQKRYQIVEYYSDTELEVEVKRKQLIYQTKTKMKGAAFYLKQKEGITK